MTPGADSNAPAGGRRSRPNLVANVATAIVADCLDTLGADAGYVATPAENGLTLDVERVTPYSAKPVHLELRADDPYPIAETMRTKRPLYVASNEQLLCDHPGLVRVTPDDHACATLPLFGDDGELLGALNLGFEDPHDFSEAELELIDVLGRHCAEAMALARRLENELRRPRALDLAAT